MSPSVAEVMTRAPVTLHGDASVHDARMLLRWHDKHHLVVVDGAGLIGVVCATELTDLSPRARLRDLLHYQRPVTITATASLGDAAATMRRNHIGCLPVLERLRVVGLITRGDLQRAGVSRELIGPVCTACGGYHDIEAQSDGATSLCPSCQRRSKPPHPHDDLGGGD